MFKHMQNYESVSIPQFFFSIFPATSLVYATDPVFQQLTVPEHWVEYHFVP